MPRSSQPLPPVPAARGGRRPALERRRLLAGLGVAFGASALGACAPDALRVAPGNPGPAGEPGASRKSPDEAPPVPGRLLYAGNADLWRWEKGLARRLTGDRVSRQPAWSPDGRWIAHVKIDVSSSDLWLMDDESANAHQLTANYSTERAKNNWAYRPVWWPDGSRLLYLTDETTYDLMLWQVGADGKGRRPLLTVPDREGGIDGPSLSPDARRLAVVTFRATGTRAQVWTFTLPNGPWQQLTDSPDGAYDPAWSPDGTRLAYVVRHGGRHDLWLMGADGANQTPLTASGAARAPCWSPDGKWLAFLCGEGGAFDVWALPVPGPAGAPPDPPGGAAPRADLAPPAGAGPGAEPPNLPQARPLTRGAGVDPVSGLSWTA
jgi:TolB protein